MGLSLRKLGDTIGNVASGVERQLNPFDNGATYSNPTPPHPNGVPGSLISQAPGVAAGVVRFIPQFAENYANTFANLGNRLGGGQNQTIQQNMGGDTLSNKILKFSQATGKNAQLAGDVAQAGLTAIAPGESKIIEGGVARALPGVANTVLPRVVSNAAIAGGFNAAGAAGNGADLPQTLKAAGQGALVGAAFPVTGAGLKLGAKGVVKLNNSLGNAGLNEAGIGAVGKNVNTPPLPTGEAPKTPPTPVVKLKQAGQGSGLTPDQQMFQSLGGNPKDLANLQSLSDAKKAELDSKTQMALANFEKQNVPLAPKEINTAKNPFKSDIPEVQPGDYKQVISNEQAASNPVQFAGQRWIAAMQKLQPNEQVNFWRAVEKPETATTPELQNAITAWREVDNRIHGTSQQLGGNTNYLQNHNLHPWNLPPEFTDHIVNGGDPTKFSGLNNLSRKYQTIAEGEANGLTLGTDPISEGNNYINASAALLKRRAIVKGLGEADGLNPDKLHAFDIGGGNSIPISQEARKAVRGLQRSRPSDNAVIKGARTVNAGLKSSILSLGQFHPINIAALRAAPTLALRGHPVAAVKGLTKTFRVLAPGGNRVVQQTLQKALDDGMVDKAAKIGMPYGAGGFDTEGSLLKGGIGHHTVFEKQMPMMHDQVVRSVVADLEKKNIPLDSAEARAAGKAGNNLMGFVNKEAQNIPPQVNRSLGDFLLAKQFTHSKFSQLKTAATTGGVAGSYARANVAANVAATTLLITGIGYIGKQKSDNVKDLLLRALVDPAAPTSMKDSKGNTVKLRTPGTDTSDIAKLLGIKLVRNKDGHLGVSWKPGNMPSTVEDYARARLSPFLSSGVKVATNTTFAGKPLYDPNAKFGTQAEQAGTSLVTGLLPIGAQGLPMVNAVEKHLPGNVQDVLNAQKPGSNPLVKSVGSSFGLTPTTDTTVGKGLQSTQYFSALDQAKSGLNAKEKDALDIYAGSKKNPVTGKYDVMPNANDTVAKARALLDQPKVIDNLIAMNKTLVGQGQKVDPLWQQSKDKITKVLQYQAMPPGGADRTHWEAQNGSWYNPLSTQRTAFFNSLPTGDPNKPQAPIQYPNPPAGVADLQKQFFDITDSAQRAKFLQDHPEVQTQLDAQVDYNNKMREAQGYSALDKFPTASPDVQKIINEYNSVPKGGGKKGGNLYRSQWITSHPDQYKAMSDYYTQASLYGLQKEAGQAQFADSGASQKLLKDAYNLGKYDIVKNADGTYSLGSSYSSGGSGGYSGSKYISRTAAELQNPFYNAIDISTGGKPKIGKAQKPKVSNTTGGGFKVKKAGFQPKSVAAVKPAKMKVNLKKSRV